MDRVRGEMLELPSCSLVCDAVTGVGIVEGDSNVGGDVNGIVERDSNVDGDGVGKMYEAEVPSDHGVVQCLH